MRTQTKLTLALIAIGVALPVCLDGGTTRMSQAALTVVAGLALGSAWIGDERALGRVAASPAVAALTALAALSLLSAVWTVADTGDAFEWGLVVAAYAGLALAAGTVVREPGGWQALAGLLVMVAVGLAVAGLAGVVLREPGLAERVIRTWRPDGTLQYPPGLAEIQLLALPALAWAMVGARPVIAGWAAAAAVPVAGCIALADSRAALAIAAAILLSLAALHRGTRARAVLSLAVCGALAGAGALVVLIGGGEAGHRELGGDAGRASALVALTALLAVCWWGLRSRPGAVARLARSRAALALAGAAAIAGACLALAAMASEPSGEGAPDYGGPAHGREELWADGIATFADRPVLGSGAESFFEASLVHQGGEPIRYAHSLPVETAAELGIAGLLAVLVLYAATAGTAWRQRREAGGFVLGAAALSFLAAGLVDFTWHIPAVAAPWAVALGGLAGSALRESVGAES